MRRTPLVAAALVAAAALVPFASPASGVVGGASTTAYLSVPSLLITTGTGQAGCTGTLIRRDIVLTAAHCLDGSPAANGIRASFRLNRNATGEQVFSSSYAVRPDYNGTFAANDVAIIKLQAAVTTATPILPASITAEPRYPTAAQIVGWGAINQAALPVVEPTYVDAIQAATLGVQSGCGDGPTNAPNAGNLCGGGGNKVGACYGDSGGPLLATGLDGSTRVIGVISRGEVPCASQPTDFGRVLSSLDWIIDTARRGTVTRLAGLDRYATAAQVALRSAAPGGTVYLATGEDFADALAAAPLAGAIGAPVLLTPAGALPPATSAALTQLAPARVIVTGGTTRISDAVVQAVTALLPGVTIERVAGPDRFATAALLATNAVAQSAATTPVPLVFVATGRGFADALSAGAVAGRLKAPVLLTETDALPQPTVDALTALAPQQVVVVGGTGVVSANVAAQLAGLLPGSTIDRVAGNDRFETASLLNDRFPTAAPAARMWFATGLNFPDALGAAARAALEGAPLLLTSGDAVPGATASATGARTPAEIVLVGGPSSVSRVAEFTLDGYR